MPSAEHHGLPIVDLRYHKAKHRTTAAECPWHGLRAPCCEEPVHNCWWIVRCAHLDNRFVVAMRNRRGTCFVDYVEDLPDGDLLVEPHTACFHGGLSDVPLGYNEGAVNRLFEELERKMLAGEPPHG